MLGFSVAGGRCRGSALAASGVFAYFCGMIHQAFAVQLEHGRVVAKTANRLPSN